ncbi:Hint domain-containing protein [Sulfitobacter marinus]|uniref:Hint domain-containing protein n=1 Tax=Sulfitobacter marinus TaxID=394264 RepID=A0A1I6RLQ2_9RHOB|nr:Hint domain-containing protein [Sulfitobacter marinus]SFS65576.1 Hint domain-containing protein [Sulfitobacter marinus]
MQTNQPSRSYEIVAKRADGTVFIGQNRAPTLPVFENAFAAFAHGSPVLTTEGEIAVEDLHPGDMIVKSDGTSSPLIWIGSSSFVPADTGQRTPLVRVMADSLGVGRPTGFVTFGPSARILHTPLNMRGEGSEKEILTPVRDLVDGVNIIAISPPTPVRLYHLCLDEHATITVGGLSVETFHPGIDFLRDVPIRHRDQFLGMFPHIRSEVDFGALCHPRAPDPSDMAMSA